jgi:hypothetical protein
MGVASLWLGVWQLLLLCVVWAGQLVWGKEHVCSPGRLPQIIRIGKFHERLFMIGGMFCVLSCYWLVWVGQVILVCSPGRLPQIIRISCMAASDWWDVLCATLLLAGVGGAGDPCL